MKDFKEWLSYLIPIIFVLFAWVFKYDFFLQLFENSYSWRWFVVLASLTALILGFYLSEGASTLFLISGGGALNLLPGVLQSNIPWLTFLVVIGFFFIRSIGFIKDDFEFSRTETIRVLIDFIKIVRLVSRKNRNYNESIIQSCEHTLQQISTGSKGELLSMFRSFLLTTLGDAYSELPTGNRDSNLKRANEYYEIYEDLNHPPQLSWEDDYENFDFQTYARVKYKQGNAYSKMPSGDPGENLYKAIDLYKAALQYEDSLDLVTYLAILENLGNAYFNLNTGNSTHNLRQAIEYYEQALNLSKTEWDQRSIHNTFLVKYLAPRISRMSDAQIYLSLGTANLRMSNAKDTIYATQAINYFQQALDSCAPDTDPLLYAFIQHGLGNAYSRLQTEHQLSHIKQAIKHYHEAVLFCYPEIAPLEYASIQADLGKAYYSLYVEENSDLVQKQALDSYQEALRFLNQDTAPFEYRQVNHNLGDIYLKQSNWESAFIAYSAAIEADQQLYNVRLFNKDKAKDSTLNADLYQKCSFVATRFKEPVDALTILERGKGRVLSEVLQLYIPHPKNINNELWKEFEEASELKRTAWSQGWSSPDGESDSLHTYANRVTMVDEANNSYNLVVKKIREQFPSFLTENNVIDFNTILDDKSTALITFSITEQGSVGFLVSHRRGEPSGSIIQLINLPTTTKEMLIVLIQEYVKIIQDATKSEERIRLNNGSDYWLTKLKQIIDEISENLLNPILDKLPQKIKRLVFLPTSELSILPLHMAWHEINGHRQYLIDDFEITYAPSAYAFGVSQQRARELQDYNPSLLGIIDPTKNLDLASLEGESIANLFSPQVQTLLLENEATKERFLELHPKYSIWHFSCHGNYDWKEPLNSHLVLANETKLTLANIIGELDVNTTRLVTMSACVTGLTDMDEWANEYIGLPVGFLQAGIPSIISTLWPVNDHSTSLLMDRFYYNHLVIRMTLSQALRQAQLWLRDATRKEIGDYYKLREVFNMYLITVLDGGSLDDKLYSHPYYWAAFIFTGN